MAKTRSPLHSIAASGIFGGVVAAVQRKTGPHYLRRAPRRSPITSPAQLAIRNAWRVILAALHYAFINASAPRPYPAGYRAAWRALVDSANTWSNHAQTRIAAQAYENTSPTFPAWQDMTAHQRQAWNTAATTAEPPFTLIQQDQAGQAPPTTMEPGLALLLHELAAPWLYITNPPHPDYPPMYRATPGNYTRAFWDFAWTPWDAGDAVWDDCTIATWADVPAPGWDAGATFWDAR